MPGRPGGRDRPETPPHSPQVARSRAGLYTLGTPLMGEGRGGMPSTVPPSRGPSGRVVVRGIRAVRGVGQASP
jgi:hypothetical protein